MQRVDYFFSVASPWAYLGSSRFQEILRSSGAACGIYPVDLERVFAATGGLPYPQRSPARRTYRQVELARWSQTLGIPITLEPQFYPVDRTAASCLLIAAREQDASKALALSHAILRTIWADEGDISDWQVLQGLLPEAGFDAELLGLAQAEQVAKRYQADTDLAIQLGVFGSPSYVVDREIFWGQDRLDFLAQRLSA